MVETDIHIVGGGIIGLCAAYYLQEAGFSVTILERGDFREGCSHGNAGMIVPSHFIPLATPGVIAKGLAWMFSASSPFYIRPRMDLPLLQWLWQFYRASNGKRAAAAMPVLCAYNQMSKNLYADLSQQLPYPFGYEEKGLLLLCNSEKYLSEENKIADKAINLGLNPSLLRGESLAALENGTSLSVAGAIYYPGDAHLYPNQLMQALTAHLAQKGVQFLPNTEVSGFRRNGFAITHLQLAEGQTIKVKKIILAAGAWTAQLAKKMGISLLLQDGKGYSFTLSQPTERPVIPSILVEDKVAVTPMGSDLRIGGTLEISGMRNTISPSRLAGITHALPKYYPRLQPEIPTPKNVWTGFRPCSPDGLPYLGKSKHYNNVIVASGHAMMGLSLGPATGKLISQICMGEPTSIALDLLHPDRFS